MQRTMPLKVGVLGAGAMGTLHAEILSTDSRVKIVSVADPRQDARESFAKRFNAEVYPDLDSMVQRGLDILYVTTPNTIHTEATLLALKENIHVFCEKPFAASLEEAQAIVDAAGRSKSIYQGGHNRRFAPAYRFLKERITAGFVPYLATIKMNDGDLKDPPWLSDRKKCWMYTDCL